MAAAKGMLLRYWPLNGVGHQLDGPPIDSEQARGGVAIAPGPDACLLKHRAAHELLGFLGADGTDAGAGQLGEGGELITGFSDGGRHFPKVEGALEKGADAPVPKMEYEPRRSIQTPRDPLWNGVHQKGGIEHVDAAFLFHAGIAK